MARYLYEVNRCGIAHGKSGPRLYDFAEDVREVARDVFILKLLARLAIQDEEGTRPSPLLS